MKERFDGRKLLALTEFGGVPDIERMHAFGVWWAWFAPWTGNLGPRGMPEETVIRIYQSPDVVTLDELNAVPPRFVSSAVAADGTPEFLGTGPRGSSYRVLAATNVALPLDNWSQSGAGRFSGGVFSYADEQWTNQPSRFFRVVKP